MLQDLMKKGLKLQRKKLLLRKDWLRRVRGMRRESLRKQLGKKIYLEKRNMDGIAKVYS